MCRLAATSGSSRTARLAIWCGKRLGAAAGYLDFGTASSPVVHGGRIYQLFDNEGESFLAALDSKNGGEVWTVERTGFKSPAQSGWATPFIWKNERRTEIVTIGKGTVVSCRLRGRNSGGCAA